MFFFLPKVIYDYLWFLGVSQNLKASWSGLAVHGEVELSHMLVAEEKVKLITW